MLRLGNRMKMARKRAGMTQEQLADAIAVSRSSIAQYEAGDKEPTIWHLAEIARTLRVSADYLLGLEDRLPKDSSMSEEARAALNQFIQEIRKS